MFTHKNEIHFYYFTVKEDDIAFKRKITEVSKLDYINLYCTDMSY